MSTSAFQPALLTSRQVRAGLRYNIVAACGAYVWLTVVFGMPLTMLLEAMGASGALMGLTHSLRQVAMVLMIPGALLAEFASRRKPTWMVLTLLQRLLWFLPAFALLWRCDPATIVAATILATSALSLGWTTTSAASLMIPMRSSISSSVVLPYAYLILL